MIYFSSKYLKNNNTNYIINNMNRTYEEMFFPTSFILYLKFWISKGGGCI